jgi:hypothetical protein
MRKSPFLGQLEFFAADHRADPARCRFADCGKMLQGVSPRPGRVLNCYIAIDGRNRRQADSAEQHDMTSARPD